MDSKAGAHEGRTGAALQPVNAAGGDEDESPGKDELSQAGAVGTGPVAQWGRPEAA